MSIGSVRVQLSAKKQNRAMGGVDPKQYDGKINRDDQEVLSPEKLDSHLNVSVATANVLRLLSRKVECSVQIYR